MNSHMFVNREKEIERLQNAFVKEKPQLIVVYGRRRCGKSTLLHRVLPPHALYFSADLREPPLQILALAKQVDALAPGFSRPVYPDWESLFHSLNSVLKSRTIICIDEFPYLVKNSPELPSILQKITEESDKRNFHLILCGSSQQMMYSMVLDSSSPLYGRCDEIIRVKPMGIKEMHTFLSLRPEEAVMEYGAWGGVPRYWEIRKEYKDFTEAVKKSILDQNGILYEEPERLFSDEMRTSVQAFSVMSLIGSGVHKPSEIARRLGKPVTQLSRLFGFLINQGYIRREVPFGESGRSAKRSLYKIDDPFLNFYFNFLIPNKSRLESGMIEEVWQGIDAKYNSYLSGLWEDLCRKMIHEMVIDGKKFNPASRWWGTGTDKKAMEIDLLSESLDRSSLLVGEVKWSDKVPVGELASSIDSKIAAFPFVESKSVIKALFLKERPGKALPGFHVFTPSDMLAR